MGKSKADKMKRYCLILFSIILLSTTIVGCSSKNSDEADDSFVATNHDELIYEETISPNKEYVTSDKDIVNYTIQIYQDEENAIIVNADSNSGFFDKLQYVLQYDKPISEADVKIQWTTLMGNPESTEDNQLAIARVSISSNGEVFSERKINFVNKGLEIVIDTINKSRNGNSYDRQ